MVFRVYVEKKQGFDVEAKQLANELKTILGIASLKNVRLVNRYDVEGISEELFAQATPTVFSEPQVDNVSADLPDFGSDNVFAVEYLPGQFDQRADSASECIQLISQGERPTVRSAKVYALEGELSDADIAAIKHYVINPVEAREASLDTKTTLKTQVPVPGKVEVIEGFRTMSDADLEQFIADRGLAMDLADVQFCRAHFTEEHRDPTITEIKVIDTYWSDHCRHTTFGTQLDDVQIDDATVQAAFDKYLEMRHELGRDEKPVCLMDMGTIGAKWLKKNGILKNLDESEEINACTVKVKVDVNGHDEDWLFLFKNETHNHPTEIEPFGGAATCIGGCIRDPLSGRSYVYQAMRVTGAADPTVPVSETLEGKLPQRKLVTTAAAGYSSYGNQIGLATGQVDDLVGEIHKTIEKGERVLVTTLTKRMAESLTEYLKKLGIRVRYLHSDIQTMERTKLIRDLRLGEYDVLVGINLLREGLDMPEVSLVAIMDADKEGFLRSQTSLIQTIGRAARNVDGRVILYGDILTESMEKAMNETNRRRALQQAYNELHGITPKSVQSTVQALLRITDDMKAGAPDSMSEEELQALMKSVEDQMLSAAKALDFEKAAKLRDQLFGLKGEGGKEQQIQKPQVRRRRKKRI